MVRIAINGYGRIGRNILKAFYERPELKEKIEIVAINDRGDVSINAHLTQYDSVHGRFGQVVNHDEQSLIIGDDHIKVLSESDPTKLPWRELKVDVVFECTGAFTEREKAAGHLEAGAQKVLVSAPGKNMDATVVFGINDHMLTPDHKIVSNASCTTNCLAPMVKPLHDAVGIESGFMTTIHAYTNDQHLTDVYHSDLYRARSATQSMIPTKTGAAKAIGLVLPELAGKLDGMAVRVPTANVSLVDLTIVTKRETTVEEINSIMQEAALHNLRGVLGYTEQPLVSIDFNHTAYSSIFDASHTRAQGNLVKVLSWYDNEWGFSNRMLDTCLALT
ncbi:MAG: type I glyceraldehyde-3-phosphate dehydrogenase [Porticoccus sp.]|nr:type I glyceraldehyde-3-phosphate dehydrogenase [Porticoccus sp.]MBQ0806596.1 type I glyceraldehyde-3-phosphate dehydrogenase [Porticoccus sp.]